MACTTSRNTRSAIRTVWSTQLLLSGLCQRQEHLDGHVLAELAEAFEQMRPQASGLELADDLPVAIDAASLEFEDVVHRHDGALQAHDLADVCHAPGPVLQTSEMDKQIDARCDLFADGPDRQVDGHKHHVFD